MSLYRVAFLFTCMCCWSHGHPLNDTYGTLGKSLKSLADQCDNSFLSGLIKSKLDTCNMASANSEELELQCIMFYNINRQLCTTFQGAKVDMSVTYSAGINETQKVETFCNIANTWKFADLPEYSQYSNTFKKIFSPSSDTLCFKFCADENVLSHDTNFYCKYFKWGSDMLKLQITTTPPSGGMPAAANTASAVPESALKTDNNSATLGTTKIDNTSKPQLTNLKKPLQGAVNDDTSVNVVESSVKINMDTHVTAPSSMNSHQLINNQAQSPVELGEIDKHVKQNVAPSDDSIPTTNKLDKDKLSDLATSLTSNDNNESETNPQLKAPSLDLDDGDDTDLDSEDHLPEAQQANDGNGPVLESDPKLDEEKSKSMPKNVVGEFYSNTLQEGFPEDDDHFFPFFLTAIILAVLLYVLYHNKSKFRKIFMGLLVEGRQSGRRRNSRGHTYRRLDTLEQAMSANSAAPPSKIIY